IMAPAAPCLPRGRDCSAGAWGMRRSKGTQCASFVANGRPGPGNAFRDFQRALPAGAIIEHVRSSEGAAVPRTAAGRANTWRSQPGAADGTRLATTGTRGGDFRPVAGFTPPVGFPDPRGVAVAGGHGHCVGGPLAEAPAGGAVDGQRPARPLPPAV